MKLGSRSLCILYLKDLFMLSMSQIGLSGGEYICSEKKRVTQFLSGLIWLWPLTSKHHSRSLTPFNQIPPVDKVWTRLDKGERDMCPDKDFWINSAIWPSHLTLKLKSRPLNILWPQHFVGEVWVWLDKGERKYALDKDFSFYYAIIKILDLDTWFKLTAHPLPRGTLRKKYEPDWAKGRKYTPDKWSQTNQETDHNR